jgi:hypothetical protein
MIFKKWRKKKASSIEELKKAQHLFKYYDKSEPKLEMIEIRYKKDGTIEIEDKETNKILKLTLK